MLILRDPESVACNTDGEVRDLAEQRFMDLSAEDDYDPDIDGHFIVVEPGDSVDALEAESGCPILHSCCGTARYGEPGFSPVFECLEEHPSCYEMVFVPGEGDLGIVLFIPKKEGIDPELLSLCAEYAEPAP